MNFDGTYFVLGFIFSTVGLIYFNYGRKQKKIAVALSGLVLMVYPYFLNSTGWLVGVGVVLMLIPKFVPI